QTILQAKPKSMRIRFDGRLAPGTESKDLILHLIGRLGAQSGIGYAAEFTGDVIRDMSVESRLTLCNMGVEFSAKYVFVPPDDKTFAYLEGREYSPKGAAWDRAVAHWRALASDEDAVFDREERFDCTGLAPQVTWGISPQHVAGIGDRVPDPADAVDAEARQSMERALAYIGLAPGTPLAGVPIEAAYIGSCTNARLSDLRAAAKLLEGRRVADGVQAVCVPGSTSVKRAAEAEGLDRIFIAAGFEWHESGCGLCGGMGNPRFAGRRVISTTNRNFENRQGRGARTHLASPLTVAASALSGRIADPRPLHATQTPRSSTGN
ncbi:MAG: aconitase family protein, partial [Lautropia sp.]